ncbi:MAG: YARHG domain-containing protein [Clostridia bacterium]|nr:YARHG domain-containing protein [Clostridia bacterium]
MFRQQDHEALNGRPGSERIRWRERFSPSEYNYVLPEGYPPNIDQLTGTVVPWETIQSFLSDAFGVSDLALDDVKTQDGQYVILLDSDPGGWATEPVGSVPLKAENGIITLNGIASWDGDGPAKEYEIQLHVVQDPSSRYGCNVKSVTFVPVRDVYDSDTDASGAAPAASRGFDANGFVFADSSERYLTAEDLQGLSKEMLAFARNEIFARNGNVFKTDKYINHYTKYAWYNNMPNKRYDINPEELSAIEQANIRLIRQFEAA